MSDWLRPGTGFLRFDVRLTPGAGANEMTGIQTDAAGRRYLKARVTAIADKNRANRALVALVAEKLGVGKTSVEIAAGHTSRIKIVQVTGEAGPLADRLTRIAEGD